MLAEFMELLSRLQSFKKGQLWVQAAGLIDKEFERLMGSGADAVAQLSDTELLAKVIRGEPTQAVRDKTLIVATLLKEAGDVAAGEGRTRQSGTFYLKGLHLLLDVLGQGDLSDWPDFVPHVETFKIALEGSQLPLETLLRLMQHYERAGEFAKAEDALFEIHDLDTQPPGWAEFGAAFYERLLRKPDSALEAGNLPRTEVDAGLSDLRKNHAPA